MKRLFVTGASGMLGSYAAAQAAEAGWEVRASYGSHPVELPGCTTFPMQLTDRAQVVQTIASFSPDAIIHPAAISKPDLCEQDKRLAFDTNVIGTYNVILAAESVGARLVHISTDTVFNGKKNPYKEDDPLTPPNYYGLTKAAAEGAVRASKIPWAIVRTSVIFGPRKFAHLDSFSDRIIDALRVGQRIRAYADQYRSPIPAWNLADACLEIAERGLTGVYHVACPESISRLDWALGIADVFHLDRSLVEPMYMDATPSIAPRSKVLVLDMTNTLKVLGTHLLGIEEGLSQLQQRMSAQNS